MHRRTYAADWERRKEYLIRSSFLDQLVLSPIYESPEPRSHEIADYGRFSPLPDLIIERQKRYAYEDETKEFYDKLEVKMKKLYRRLFLKELIDDDEFDELEITCGEQIPDYSDDEARDGSSDENGNEFNGDSDKAETLQLQEERTATNSETSLSESLEVAEETDLSEEQLAEPQGKRCVDYSDTDVSSSHQSKIVESEDGRHLESMVTEDEDESSSTEILQTAETVTQAVIEREKSSSSLENLEAMRRQQPQSSDHSMQLDRQSSKDVSLDLNTARPSMEQVDESLRDSVAMEIETAEFHPLMRISTASYKSSPILGKRKQASQDLGIQTPIKRSKVVQQVDNQNVNEMNTNKTPEKPRKNDAWTETDQNNKDMETQTTIPETYHFRNAGAQTSLPNQSGVHEVPMESKDVGTQTDIPDTRDNNSQTTNYNFEYWRGPLGFRFYFFF